MKGKVKTVEEKLKDLDGQKVQQGHHRQFKKILAETNFLVRNQFDDLRGREAVQMLPVVQEMHDLLLKLKDHFSNGQKPSFVEIETPLLDTLDKKDNAGDQAKKQVKK